MTTEKICRKSYQKPELVKLDNVKELTYECFDWQCSVTVPPAPVQ